MRDKHKNKRSGFTLMELLAVVAILAVLVAVAIALFSASADKAEAAVCTANCRAAKGMLTTQYISGERTLSDGKKETLGALESFEPFVCPAGGEIYYVFNAAEGDISVRCPIHDDGETPPEPVKGTWDKGTAKNIEQILRPFGKLESTSGSADVDAALKKLKTDLNVDFEGMGIKSWIYSNIGGGWALQWTTVDVSQLEVGDEVVVMRYRPADSQFPDIYSVWKEKVVEQTADGVDYLSLAGIGNEIRPAENVDKTDFELMLQFYNDNCGKQPQLNTD